nr:penicillin-binding protein activator [Shewanella sp. NIFS-20-20]
MKSLNRSQLICLTVFALTLGGCATQTPAPKAPETQVSLANANESAQDYLAQAQLATTADSKQRLLLLASQAYLKQGDYLSADHILSSLASSLAPTQELQAQYRYLQAWSLQQQGQDRAALELLNYPSQWQLANWQLANRWQLQASILGSLSEYYQQAKALNELSRYVPKNASLAVQNHLWRVLQTLPEETLSHYQSSQDPRFAGWLQLAYIAKHFAVDPSQLVRYLGQWQRQNPMHPAAKSLPQDLQNALNTQPYSPTNIAVLLPLSGKFAALADPIKQGIIDAYLAEPEQGVSVNFFDTANSATEAYQQALAAGAEFIIGPLLPSAVTEVNQLPHTVPQLYLNQVEQKVTGQDQYFFALSPTEEAQDGANRLYQDGIRHPLLLVSDDATSRRMATSFAERWQQLGDEAAEIHYYQAGDKMKLAVQQALGVKDSQERITRMKELLGTQVEADFRSRQDVDAIYMISGPNDLSLLKPFIDVNVSVFSTPAPLYTSSRSRLEGDRNAIEFNNLTVSDIPWLISPTAETQAIGSVFPRWQNSQKRLFAMGYDSLSLVNKLAQLRAFQGYQYQGLTGKLAVQANGDIIRHLSWGKYQRGSLKPL